MQALADAPAAFAWGQLATAKAMCKTNLSSQLSLRIHFRLGARDVLLLDLKQRPQPRILVGFRVTRWNFGFTASLQLPDLSALHCSTALRSGKKGNRCAKLANRLLSEKLDHVRICRMFHHLPCNCHARERSSGSLGARHSRICGRRHFSMTSQATRQAVQKSTQTQFSRVNFARLSS